MSGPQSISWFGRLFGRMLVILLCTSSLYFLSKIYLGLECWAVFFPIALIAWPIWEYLKEHHLFRRRVLLEGLSKESSKTRQFFWSGTFIKIIQVFFALFWAIALLAFSYSLSDYHWMVLLGAAFLFSLMIPIVEKLLSSQVQTSSLQQVARRWPLYWMNFIVVTVGLAFVDFYQGVPDSRGRTWFEVIEQAFVLIEPLSQCEYASWCTASASAFNNLSWHLQGLLSQYLSGTIAQYASWIVFLLKSSVIVLAMTRLFLGVSILYEKRSISKTALTRRNAFPRLFVFTLIILFVPYLYLTGKQLDANPKDLLEKVSVAHKCEDNNKNPQPITDQLEQDIADQSLAIKNSIDEQIDLRVNQLFSNLEPGVDEFLDWYFSVIGEYSILASLVIDDANEYLVGQLQEKLFEKIDIDQELLSFNESLMSQTLASLSAINEMGDVYIRTETCDLKAIDTEGLFSQNREIIRGSVAMLLGYKASAVIVTKIAAKNSFKVAAKIITKALTKLASKGGTAAAAGAAGVACGPLVWVCGPLLAISAWFAIDKIIVEVDESFNRETMRADMLEALEEQKLELANTLKQQYHHVVDSNVLQITQRILPSEEIQ